MKLIIYVAFALILAGITTRKIDDEAITGIAIVSILLICALNEVIEINKKLKK